ncbi:MAG: aminotransferase class III-fold pyridoxal phosphate-dependent enzyme [Dehalococcoidia bacterium]
MVQLAPKIEQAILRPQPAPDAEPAVNPHDVLVGGSNSAFPLPLEGCIERGQGTRVWDEDGREYIDFLLASGPLILGHAHPRVTEAVVRQVSSGAAFHTLNRPALELAARVAGLPGCVDTIRFASTGTEATLHAVRLARAYSGRDKVLVFSGSYHGSHDVSLVGHRGARAQGGGVPTSAFADTVVARFNDIASVERAFAEHGDTLAGVLIEPQQRSLDPEPGFLPRLAELCRAAGATLIFDEVLTGFRLAFGGAQEYYGVEPDIVCYGKILGGGLPLSAIGGRRHIMALADPAICQSSSYVHISGTLSGNPVSAAAGLATLEELDQPGVYERLHDLGRLLRSGLLRKMIDRAVSGRVIGSGPIAAIQFDDSDGPGSGPSLRNDVNRELIGRGILVQMRTRFYLSLLHTEAEIDCAVDAFGDALDAALARAG